MFFNVVLTIIGSLSVFSLAYIATSGGPNYATYFYVYHLFKNAFEFSRMGYAAAMAWAFFLIVLVLTAIQFRLESLGFLMRAATPEREPTMQSSAVDISRAGAVRRTNTTSRVLSAVAFYAAVAILSVFFMGPFIGRSSHR